jgi:MFS superfamily sulfate permease-like transporter
MIIHLFRGASLRKLFKPTVAVHYESIADRFLVSVHNVAIFSNYLSLKKQLDNIPKGKDVVVDFDNATLVDHTVMEHLHSYKELYEREGGTFELKEMGHLIPPSQHPLAARRTSRKRDQVTA